MYKNLLLFITTFALILFSEKADAQSLNLTFPNGGEHWINNTWSPHNIIWESSGVSLVDIEYSDDNGATWNMIADDQANSNYYSWDVPNINSAEVLIRITDSNAPDITDQSEAVFLISDQAIYYAEWETSMGNFRAKLHGDKVPMTVQNFINLTERNFYQDLIFHRVISGFMIQDGCPLGTGYGGPGYQFDNEIHPDLNHGFPGVLAMANAGPNTNGSQYYITVEETSWLDGDYSIFGRIVDGMNYVYDISEVPTDGNDKPLADVDIYNVYITEYDPQISMVVPEQDTSFIVGSTVNIEWSSDFIADVMIEFSSDGGATRTTLIDSIPAGNESYEWIVPDDVSDNCYIYVTDIHDANPSASNTIPFSIRVKPAEINRIELYEGIEPHADNANNLIGPNRVVRFRARVDNNSEGEITAPIAELSCNFPNVSILNSTVNFEPLAAGSQNWSADYFEIQFSEGFPEGDNIELIFNVQDADNPDVPWLSQIIIPIPDVTPFTVIDNDNNGNSTGDGDQLIEPGETSEFSPMIVNTGDSALYDVYGRLTSPNSFIAVWNNVSGYNGMVYDSVTYNGLNPIPGNSPYIIPDGTFVFDCTSDETYFTELILEIHAWLNEPAGPGWDEGGTAVGFALSYIFNDDFPISVEHPTSMEADFRLYPNPATDRLTLEKNTSDENALIQIHDISGKLIHEYQSGPKSRFSISVSTLQPGLYFISLETQNNRIVRKLLIYR